MSKEKTAAVGTGMSGAAKFREWLLENNCVVILIALIVVSAIVSPYFLTTTNIWNIVRQYALYVIMAVGMLFVLMSGGIDLAMGSILGVSGMMAAISFTEWGWGADNPAGIIGMLALAVGFGVLFGVINGLLIAYAGLQPFIATLAMQIAVRGVAYLVSNALPVRLFKENVSAAAWISFTNDESPIGLPWIGILTIAIVVIFTLIHKYTRYGRLCLATGSNASAVRFAGINVKKYIFTPYLIAGAMAGLAGAILVGRAGTATTDGGEGYEFDVIAGCVIGGASLDGGRGTVILAVIGMLSLGLITNLMNLLSIGASTQKIVRGAIIIAAVYMSNKIGQRKFESAK